MTSMEQETNKAYDINGTGTKISTDSLSPTYNQQQHHHHHNQSHDIGTEKASTSVGTEGGGGNLTSDVVLPESVLDKLYHTFSIKQRRAGLIWYLVASILFDVWALIIPQGQSTGALGITGVIALINIILCILLRLSGNSKLWKYLWQSAPYFVWFLSIVQLSSYLLLKTVVTPRDLLGWSILLNFLVYVTIPIPLAYTGILLGFGTFSIYMSKLIGLSKRDPHFWEQIGANAVLILAGALIGLLYYFLGEAKQKRAFLEAKKSLEVKMVIEEQSAEQERLLLSVLPEHVAVKMRQDLGSTNSEQFKKIYMSRHENVSILYADIVGFTAISSTYCAQDLVKMLNELFARFDRLAEKYHQLRIKILGDCYYCISGAPVERPDHAVLCVHMGLSMVKAIKYVQQKTNSPVDMRVGIHTGAVLAGVLGQRQWQFDVYSKDVELANKMESSGKAGSVHISEKTLGFLNGEFEVEPAFGEKREEALRIAGLKTYFIKKVLKPFVSSSEQRKNGTSPNHKSESAALVDLDSTEILPDDDSKGNSGDEDGSNDNDKDKVEDFKERLRKELVAREGHGDLSKDTTILLNFKNEELENAYRSYREPYSSIPLIVSLFVQLIDIAYSFLILPRIYHHFIIIILPVFPIGILVFISIAESFPEILPNFMVKISKKFNDINFLRRSTALIIIYLIGMINLTDMCFYAVLICLSKTENFTTTINIINNTNNENNTNLTNMSSSSYSSVSAISKFFQQTFNNSTTFENLDSIELMNTPFYPSYLSNYCVLILISIAVIAQLSHGCKILCMIIFTVAHCIMNIFVLQEQYVYEDQLLWNIGLPMRFNTSTILFVVALSLSFLARHMDYEDRVIFKWKREVAEQKEKVSDMRRRNEALVYNVLPVHVAEHFMKNRKRSHEDLYSQSYAEVGVLFASMPNFSDFYSEETVNNQGLECLRFLNEVISDYDALLELPQFQDVIKIKTIGSTYMAASGLNPSRQVKPDDPIIVRWAHLALLVEFALELKKALQGINEQSFNHFVLKMGINHGPITAGVIGARKPHYDIWGNTVNVASRMESTGKAGAIQVTEETCQILQTFGYTFEQRGLVAVKGKGQLMTYYLQGKVPRPNPPSPMLSNVNMMEPVLEVEEPAESPKVKLTQVHFSNTNVNEQQSSSTNINIHHDHNNSISSNNKSSDLKLNLDHNNITVEINPENDPRSPKNTNYTLLETFNKKIENTEQLSSKSHVLTATSTTTFKLNNGNIDNNNSCSNINISTDAVDIEIDVKTPLLNLNNSNANNIELTSFSTTNEKDSLIAND